MVFNFEKFRAGRAPKSTEEDSKPLVVIIDDDEMNLRVMDQILSAEYTTKTFDSPGDALAYCESDSDKVGVILADQSMPRMTGLEFFAELNLVECPASRLIMTGLHEHREVSDAMERREIFFYLIKPVDVERLLREMSNAMDDFFRRKDRAKR